MALEGSPNHGFPAYDLCKHEKSGKSASYNSSSDDDDDDDGNNNNNNNNNVAALLSAKRGCYLMR